MSAGDPYLQVPLCGVQLIEASAGTGKTFTLATLVTRLVVEGGLRIGQILAVTFTEAATQELRKRIRERLQLALALCGEAQAEDGSAEAALTRAMLQAHLAQGEESTEALHRRLHNAVLDIDLAAIFTIHGFCARVLREHALETGHGFDPKTILSNNRELREALAADVWRRQAQEADTADDLLALWKGGHVAFAKALELLLGREALLPPMPDSDEMPAACALLMPVAERLRQAWQAEGDAFFERLLAAIDAGVMKSNEYKVEWVGELRQWLRTFAHAAWRDGQRHPKLEKLTAEILAKGTKNGFSSKTPVSAALTAAIAEYLDVLPRFERALAQRRAGLLHRLRADACVQLATLKQQRRVNTYDDLIDGVADALAGSQGDALVHQLRAQYRVALVDEFQDTDARQCAIFNHVFGSNSHTDPARQPALFLIGDPKQAIYGFRGGDVHTYLEAGEHADKAPALVHNFRSRPCVLKAIDTLYANAGKQVFVDARIQFHPLQPGGICADADLLLNGIPAPALTLWQAPPPPDVNGKCKPYSAPHSRQLATQACVTAIHGVLSAARAGTALRKDKKTMRPLQPGDIAVLVRSYREATLMQQALALAGIPTVAASKQSLFATDQAHELHVLLLAVLHAGDDGRLRTALATVLIGMRAIDIDALDQDPVRQRDWQTRAADWAARMRRGGPLALVSELCAANAERLLGLLDGERRLSNYLQLAERLQEAQATAPGLHALVDWLQQHIANADPEDETQLLRLESDARRVQIVTLHKSKGLEYSLVFLPFVGIGSNQRSPGDCCVVHDVQYGRRLHWKLDIPEAQWKEASAVWAQAQREEDARLLYVGLTRAQHALWLAMGNFHNAGNTVLAQMLGNSEALLANGGTVIDSSPVPESLLRLPPESYAAIPAPRHVTQRVHSDWWVHSFSQLAKTDAGDASSASTLPAAGGNDESDAVDAPVLDAAFDARFVGNRFGVALHAALEHADFAAWQCWVPGAAAPAGEAGVLADALRGEGYASDVLADGVALVTQLMGQTLTVAMPEGVRLCDVPAEQRRAEIEFQFGLHAARVDALLHLLHAHDVVRERDRFGERHWLDGLMAGLIDLTYQHDGKWYVLDYKSNRLPGYDAAQLTQAMAHSEYDLQALIYTLALHRWLRFRLGDDYDYSRDFGGIRYVFCRGLGAAHHEPASATLPGIYARCFAPDLVHALDALLGHGERTEVAA